MIMHGIGTMKEFMRKHRAHFMWILAVAFFFYQLVLRMWPGLFKNQLMQYWSANEQTFGAISSVYYLSYGVMQIPMAILFERFSYRSVFFVSSVLGGVSFFCMNAMPSPSIAFAMSTVLGGASAAGFIGTAKVVSSCFPRGRYSLMMGLSAGMGLWGCIVGKSTLIDTMVKTHGLYSGAMVMGGIFMVLAVLMLFVMRQPENNQDNAVFSWSDLGVLLRSPLMWALGMVNFLLVGPQGAFADVWGSNYLTDVQGLMRSDALDLVQYIFWGLVVGSPLMPALGKRMTDFGVTVLCGVSMTVFFMWLLFVPLPSSMWVCRFAMFFLGVVCGYQTNLLSIGVDFVESQMMGVTAGLLNSLNMIGGAFFNACVGFVMSMYAGSGSKDAYVASLMVVPILACVGAVLLIMTRMSKFWKKITT
jgi:sugar phosphate permease